MLSTMTTSENFLPTNQSGCSRSPYDSTFQPTYRTNLLPKNTQTGTEDDTVLSCRLIRGPSLCHEKMAPTFRYCSLNSKEEEFELLDLPNGVIENGNGREENDVFCKEVPRTKVENELSDLVDQLETDDSSSYDQSKPLKIDPNVLKLDFSKLSTQIKRDCMSLDKLYLTDLFEMKRTSHHLSGGGLLTDTSIENFKNSPNDSLNNKLCKLSGVGLITTENVFNFENLVDLDLGSGRVSQLLNQISPSSPLTFDLTVEKEEVDKITSGISSEAESTNPFKNFTKGIAEEGNAFSPTNPFNDVCNSSSPNENPSIIFVPPRYENISLPQKSFSQCSTRSASPVLKPAEDSSVSNPFLINDTSPELCSSAASQPFAADSKFPNSINSLPGSSSFILAVPVFPIFQHSITNSSTQTVDLEAAKLEEPVYQNITNQLRKFMKRNDHSEYDLQCLKATVKDLRNSGWYYENVSWQESVSLLSDTEPGTFLIRDSSDPNFLFSLSVQTPRGPTSVRIHYVNGQFRLDAERKLIPHMPSFNSVIELIDYYVENTVKNKSNNKAKSVKKPAKHKLQKSKDQVWIDSHGNIYSSILLVKPLYKSDNFFPLQHLARLTINKLIRKRLNAKAKFNFRVTPVYESSPFQDTSFQNNFDNFCPILNIDSLPLPSKLLEYLKEYPFCH